MAIESGESALAFVATALTDDGEFRGHPFPRPGARVMVRDGGLQFIQLASRPDRVGTQRWPIRLWSVTDIEPASENTRGGRQRPDSAPVFALAFTVAEELEPWVVFGPDGWRVAAVIERAQAIGAQDAIVLAKNTPPDTADTYRRVVMRYLATRAGNDGGGFVGSGPRLAYDAIQEIAQRVDPSALTYDHEDGWSLADNEWRGAAHAFMYASVAFGCRELLDSDDREQLAAAWRSMYPDPPNDPPPASAT